MNREVNCDNKILEVPQLSYDQIHDVFSRAAFESGRPIAGIDPQIQSGNVLLAARRIREQHLKAAYQEYKTDRDDALCSLDRNINLLAQGLEAFGNVIKSSQSVKDLANQLKSFQLSSLSTDITETLNPYLQTFNKLRRVKIIHLWSFLSS